MDSPRGYIPPSSIRRTNPNIRDFKENSQNSALAVSEPPSPAPRPTPGLSVRSTPRVPASAKKLNHNPIEMTPFKPKTPMTKPLRDIEKAHLATPFPKTPVTPVMSSLSEIDEDDEFDSVKLVEETISKVPRNKEGRKYNLAATAAVNDLARRKKKYQPSIVNAPKKPASRVDIRIKPDLPEEKFAAPRVIPGEIKSKTSDLKHNRFLIQVDGSNPNPRPTVKERLASKKPAPAPTFQQEAMMDAILGALQEKEAKGSKGAGL